MITAGFIVLTNRLLENDDRVSNEKMRYVLREQVIKTLKIVSTSGSNATQGL
jgi:hypothetical protein